MLKGFREDSTPSYEKDRNQSKANDLVYND